MHDHATRQTPISSETDDGFTSAAQQCAAQWLSLADEWERHERVWVALAERWSTALDRYDLDATSRSRNLAGQRARWMADQAHQMTRWLRFSAEELLSQAPPRS